MSYKEKSLWQYVKNGMSGKWDVCRHEDNSIVGLPDISFGMEGIQGWIELKVVEMYPINLSKPVPVKLTMWQKNWLMTRGGTGGSCWVLINIVNDYYLIYWGNIGSIGLLNKDQLEKISRKVWSKRIDWDEFKAAITEV